MSEFPQPADRPRRAPAPPPRPTPPPLDRPAEEWVPTKRRAVPLARIFSIGFAILSIGAIVGTLGYFVLWAFNAYS